MNIYVASSWRNKYQPMVVEELRRDGHPVYDFRNPEHGDVGFSWDEIDPNWENWTLTQYKQALEHPAAIRGFNNDQNALDWCELIVMVLPCGSSSHLELGHGKGAGKYTAIYAPDGIKQPELMYKMADQIWYSIGHILRWIKQLEAK